VICTDQSVETFIKSERKSAGMTISTSVYYVCVNMSVRMLFVYIQLTVVALSLTLCHSQLSDRPNLAL